MGSGMRFRKKPVVVEAVLWDGDPATVDSLNCGEARPCSDGSLRIWTLEGEMLANIGDWIVKGTRGELYPCKPGPFADTFEAVED